MCLGIWTFSTNLVVYITYFSNTAQAFFSEPCVSSPITAQCGISVIPPKMSLFCASPELALPHSPPRRGLHIQSHSSSLQFTARSSCFCSPSLSVLYTCATPSLFFPDPSLLVVFCDLCMIRMLIKARHFRQRHCFCTGQVWANLGYFASITCFLLD